MSVICPVHEPYNVVVRKRKVCREELRLNLEMNILYEYIFELTIAFAEGTDRR